MRQRDNMNAKDLLRALAEEAEERRWCYDRHLLPQPSVTIMNLSPEKREILKNLKSSDVANVRWFWV